MGWRDKRVLGDPLRGFCENVGDKTMRPEPDAVKDSFINCEAELIGLGGEGIEEGR